MTLERLRRDMEINNVTVRDGLYRHFALHRINGRDLAAGPVGTRLPRRILVHRHGRGCGWNASRLDRREAYDLTAGVYAVN